MFPSKACAFTCTWKTYLLLKRQFKNNTWMKRICQNTTPISGSFADYRKKWSYSRMIDLHWALKHIALKIHLTSLIKVDFQSSLQIPFHIFRHWIADVKKKHQSHYTRLLKKVVTLFNRSGSKRAEPHKFTINTSKVNLSPHEFIHCILLRSPRRSSKPPPMLLIWWWICFYPARPENTEENQPITNLKPRTFANAMVTSKKVEDFTRRLLFCSNLYDASGMI